MGRPRERMTGGAAAALLDHGPRALTALDHMIEAADPGETECCASCGLRKVDNFRDSQLLAQLVGMRDRLARFIDEATGCDEDRTKARS